MQGSVDDADTAVTPPSGERRSGAEHSSEARVRHEKPSDQVEPEAERLTELRKTARRLDAEARAAEGAATKATLEAESKRAEASRAAAELSAAELELRASR